MKIKPFRIRTAIVLPGLVVQVRFSPRDSKDLEGDNGAWEYDPDTGKAVIYIADDIKKLAKQRYALIHELDHLWTDYIHVALTYHPDLFELDP